MESQTQIKKIENPCTYFPNKECTLNDVGCGCLNWCRKRGGWFNERPPLFAHGRKWEQSEDGAKEYEEFRKNCPHDETWTETGCDGITAFKIVRCSKCGIELEHSGQQVWGDACV